MNPQLTPLLETNIRYLPLPYRVAIEWLDASAERTRAKLDALMDHAEAHGALEDLPASTKQFYRESAAAICAKRFANYVP